MPDDPRGDDPLGDIDDALLRLRRLWTRPNVHGRPGRDAGDAVDLTHVLVLDAVTRDGDGVDVGTVAGRLQVERSTASRLVDRTVRAGYVERRRSAADARRARLVPTAAGRELLRTARSFRRGYLDDLLAGWSPDERAAFAAQLTRFADAVGGRPDPAAERP